MDTTCSQDEAGTWIPRHKVALLDIGLPSRDPCSTSHCAAAWFASGRGPNVASTLATTEFGRGLHLLLPPYDLVAAS